MVVPENDDDIIEDYDEVPAESGEVKRVTSAIGGPVKRNEDDTASSPGASGSAMPGPPKGKVSQSTARVIWLVCIVIILAGIGAVVADYQYNAFGRHVETPNDNQRQPQPNGQNTGRTGPDRELTEREKLELEFRRDVVNQVNQMAYSKAWDFYWLSVLEFEDAYDAWDEFRGMDDYEPEDRDRAIANALKHYYKAKYAEALFRHRYDEDDISMEYLPFDLDDPSAYGDELLENEAFRTYTAAEEKLASMQSRKLNRYASDVIKRDPTTDNVKNNDTWAEDVFGEWKAKYEAGVKGEFAQADLDFVNGDDYEQGEQRMFEEYLAERQE